MAAMSCSVNSCFEIYQPKHRFPNPDKYKPLFDQWVNLCGNKRLVSEMTPAQIYTNCRVCSVHFRTEDIGVAKRLKRGVVPSLNLPDRLLSELQYETSTSEFTRPLEQVGQPFSTLHQQSDSQRASASAPGFISTPGQEIKYEQPNSELASQFVHFPEQPILECSQGLQSEPDILSIASDESIILTKLEPPNLEYNCTPDGDIQHLADETDTYVSETLAHEASERPLVEDFQLPRACQPEQFTVSVSSDIEDSTTRQSKQKDPKMNKGIPEICAFSNPCNKEGTERALLKCRICWEEKIKEVLVLMSTPWAAGSPKTIKDVILFCVPSLSIQDNSYLCRTCLWQLKFTYHFIDRCLKTEDILVQQTFGVIQQLSVNNGSSTSNLEKILKNSIEKGKKIQIIFEDPEQSSNFDESGLVEDAQRDHDYTYFNSSVSKEAENQSSKENNAAAFHPFVKEEKETEENVNNDNQQNSDECFNEESSNSFDEEGIPRKTSKKDSVVTKDKENIPEYSVPPEIVELLDIAPVNVHCLTIETEMTPEHKNGLLQSGVNILNMSVDPAKKKRIIYLSRDLYYGSYQCQMCNMTFCTRADNFDHRYLHKRGKIEVPGLPMPFSCNRCSGKFSSDLKYQAHYRYFHGRNPTFTCTKCSKRFSNSKLFRNHMNFFKYSEKCELRCDKCNTKFSSKVQLESHRADVADAPCCDYEKCPDCLEKFTKQEYKEHRKLHINLLCPECGKVFHSSGALATHRKFVHNPKPGMCHECGKLIKSLKMLQHHIDVVHGQNKYSCDKCTRQFKCQIYLRKHMVRRHSEKQRKSICDICGKSFYTESGLRTHMQLVHSASKKFTCPTCGEGFARKDYLTRHLAFHEKYSEFSCTVCRMSFTSASHLARHELGGHDEDGNSLDRTRRRMRGKATALKTKPRKTKYSSDKPCICRICQKVLANPFGLKLHYKAHLRVREFHCDKCGISLQSPSSYSKHMKRHDNPNFHLCCDICHIYKSSRVELEAHKQKAHRNKKYNCKYCPAKFGKDYLLYSHESIEHKEEHAKRQALYQMLTSDAAIIVAPEGENNMNRPKKGKRVGPFEADIDQLYSKLKSSNAGGLGELENEGALVESVEGEKFNILSEEFQMTEEEVACKVITENMEHIT